MAEIKTIFRNDTAALEAFVRDWFNKHFDNVTPGTQHYAVLTAAKNDLLQGLSPATPPAPAKDA